VNVVFISVSNTAIVYLHMKVSALVYFVPVWSLLPYEHLLCLHLHCTSVELPSSFINSGAKSAADSSCGWGQRDISTDLK